MPSAMPSSMPGDRPLNDGPSVNPAVNLSRPSAMAVAGFLGPIPITPSPRKGPCFAVLAASTQPTPATPFHRVRLLGTGTYGSVYLADATAGHQVVAKFAKPDCQLSQNYLSVEGQINAILLDEDPAGAAAITAPFLGHSSENGEECLLWKYITPAKPLEDYIGDLPALAAALGCESSTVLPRIIRILLKALRTIHRIGVCHRDIKPANILVDETNQTLRLIDFGSAARWKRVKLGPFLSIAVEKIGYDRNKSPCDPLFAAPEKWVDEQYPDRFDIYSAAISIMRVVFPALQSNEGLAQFNSDLASARHDLDTWLQSQLALSAKLPPQSPLAADLQAGLTLLNDDNGALWNLLTRMIHTNPQTRISAEAALAENPILHRIM